VFINIWSEELVDIPTSTLELAFKATIRTIKWFPTIADIRAQLQQADAKAFELEDEQKWGKLLAWAAKYFHSDIGVLAGAPDLPADVAHAARAAGGLHWISNCPEDQLVWCRKNFLAALKSVRETGQVEHLLGPREAKRIVNELRTGAVRFRSKELPAPAETVRSEPGAFEMPENLRHTLQPEQISEEEWRRREARAKEQEDALRVKLGFTREEWEQKKVEARERVLGQVAGAKTVTESETCNT
jgi:hypothetical protein